MNTSMESPSDVVIIHLSDLHFSGYLQNVHGQGEWNSVAKTHDFQLILEMESHIKPILNDYRDRAIVVVTGDLTTAAEPPAYETVSTYLRGRVWINGHTKVGLGLIEDFGLRDRLIVVPGNHDTWLKTSWLTQWKQYEDRGKLFDQYFGSIQGQHIRPCVVGGISFLFFLINSNELVGTIWDSINLRNTLGRGRVGKHQIGQLMAEYQGFVGDTTKWPKGFGLDNAIRIALMHHHPAITDDVPQDNIEQKLLELEDSEPVRRLLHDQLKVDLTLCGHQHFPYLHPKEKINGQQPWLSCSGSATQRGCKINSFKIYKTSIQPKPSIIMQEFRRDNNQAGAKFIPKPTQVIL